VAINPPSDLVLGSVLAADPAKYREAAERLQRAAGARSAAVAAAASPEPTAEKPAAATAAAVPPPAAPRLASTPVQAAPPRQAGKAPDAFAQLEAFVLQSFIQTMLPSSASGQAFFGKGTAGEVWKSMLAEKLGAELARSGQVGLAKRLGQGNAPMSPMSAAALGGVSKAPPSLLDALPYLQSSLVAKSSERS
jgi:peptidoglycan hydrolase FlgJ